MTNSKNKSNELMAIEKTAEEISTAVSQISRAMQALDDTRLKRKAVIVLLQHMTKLPQRTIEYVINSLEQLESEYLKIAKEELK